MFRRLTLLAAVPVAALLGACLLLPSTAAACPTDGVCTNELGEYTMNVSLIGPAYEDHLVSCEWKAHVDFGDGSPSYDTVVNGEYGFSALHSFPPYGKYHATLGLSNGRRADASTEPCPDLSFAVNVYYQSPQQIKEEEARLKAEQEAKERREAEERTAAEAKELREREELEARERAAMERLGGGGGGGSRPEGSTGGGGQSGPPSYWRTCRGRIQVHAVGCAKARRVVGGARRRNLLEDGPQDILGFTCRLTASRPARISCRHGKSRILAPL